MNRTLCVCLFSFDTNLCVYVLQAEKDAKKKARAKELKKLKKAREKEEKEKEKEKAKVSVLISELLGVDIGVQLHKSNLSRLLMSSSSILGLLLFNVQDEICFLCIWTTHFSLLLLYVCSCMFDKKNYLMLWVQ